MKKITIFLISCAAVLSARVALAAQVIPFGDNSIFWPNWSNSDNDLWPGIDNDMDVIGVPDFTGGQAVVDNGWLTSLTFNRASEFSSVLSPGDLFIDLGADQNWDYLVDLTKWKYDLPSSKPRNNPDPAEGYYNLYSIDLALGDPSNASGYILSGIDNSAGWRGYYIRDTHPVAAANIPWQNGGSVYFSGWTNSSTAYTFTLPNSGLNLGNSGQFTIGWTPNCANDVIYETLKYAAIPEPASLSLLALGLLGLVGLKRKRS